ncbi:histidine phosphatase family protein [Azorhizobium doebereinerae]|uniref:histidine phosphatase family protein n=1 Tax=Azorhizobium doebereinerae TaxID=281091 RepID=UPI00041A48FB|nr:histidine phosphatase family protein [Azorhizobium doebereinerae]
MVRRLVLICHGATAALRAAAFPADEPLEPGAEAAAARLAGALPRFDAVRIAPELRTRQTAAAAGLAGTLDADLRDWDSGAWRGRSFAALQAGDPEGLAAWRADPDAAPHGGESLTRLLGRAGGWLEGIAGAGERVVAVTHPALVRAVVTAALGAPAEMFWRMDVTPLSHTEVRGGKGRWTLRIFGAPAAMPHGVANGEIEGEGD